VSGTGAGRKPAQVIHEALTHVPVSGQHEKRPAVRTTKRACESGLIKRNPIQHLSTLCDSYAARLIVQPARRPDRTLGIHADPIGQHLGEGPAVVQAAVIGDVESRQLGCEGLGDDQSRVVLGYAHPIGKGDVVGNLVDRAVRSNRGDEAGRYALVGMEVGAAVDVDGAAPVDNDLVEPAGQGGQIGMINKRAVRLLAQQSLLGTRTMSS